MRERITLVHPGETSGFDSDAVKAQSGGLSSPNFQTAREDRLTIPLDQLPPEVRKVIRHFSDLNLRWTSPWAFETLNPFASRLSSPGLHVAYTPVSANEKLVTYRTDRNSSQAMLISCKALMYVFFCGFLVHMTASH